MNEEKSELEKAKEEIADLRERLYWSDQQRDLFQPQRHFPYPSLWNTIKRWWECRTKYKLKMQIIKEASET